MVCIFGKDEIKVKQTSECRKKGGRRQGGPRMEWKKIHEWINEEKGKNRYQENGIELEQLKNVCKRNMKDIVCLYDYHL
jgi:hypothetical protein